MKSALIAVPLFVFVASAHSDESEPQAVVDTFKVYRAALKAGEVEDALTMMAKYPKRPAKLDEKYIEEFAGIMAANLREEIKGFSESMVSGELHFWIFPTSARVVEDCAVILIGDHEAPAADDPVYLIQQNKKWKIIPELTRWDREFFDVTERQRMSFIELAKHVEEQKRILRGTEKPVVE